MKFISMCEKYNPQGKLNKQCGLVLHKYLYKTQHDIISDSVNQGLVFDEKQGDILTLTLLDGAIIRVYEEYSDEEYFKIYIEKELENSKMRLLMAYDQWCIIPYEVTGLMETEDNLYVTRYIPVQYDEKDQPNFRGSTKLLNAIFYKKELSTLNPDNILDAVSNFSDPIDLEFLFDKNKPTYCEEIPVCYSYGLGVSVSDIADAAFDIENRFREISATKKRQK